MNTKRRNRASLLLILTLCFIFPQTVAASINNPHTELIGQAEYGVLWVNTISVNPTLSFNGSKALCGATVIGKSGTSEITATVILSRRNSNGTYTAIKTWSNLSASGTILIFNGTYYVATDNLYRLTITATVYINGYGETVSSYTESYAF